MTESESRLPAGTPLAPSEVAGQLQSVLVHLWSSYRRNVHTNHAPDGIPQSQLAILSELVAHGPARVSDLAASLRVRQPSITVTVHRLITRGLVTRWARSIDRREVHIDITGQGRSVHRNALAAQDARTAVALAQLSKQDREALRRALPLLEKVVQTATIDHKLSDGTHEQSGTHRSDGVGQHRYNMITSTESWSVFPASPPQHHIDPSRSHRRRLDDPDLSDGG